MTKPLSVQLYSVRDQLADDRDGVLRRLAEIGYGAVEPFRPTTDPHGFRKAADDLGLVISSVHSMELIGDNPTAVFEAAAVLGTDLVILPAGIPPEDFTTTHGLERAADTLNDLSGQAVSFGQRIGYHNHWWEFEPKVEGRPALEVLAGLLVPDVFLEIDTYWAAVTGADVPAVLRNLGERVRALHIKDGPVVKQEPHSAVGRGRMPVPAILDAAPRDAWRIVELDSCATDMLDALAASHTYLNSLEQA
ncbi:sugar phosphate isomerase/epimerase [Streptomyces sp. JH14]|uniref:sugar phosphate isomerase/epimerase family protein n=1 Tax=Streptomyces sp. JH14 TaxID=2793630 RepID=UPI0023F70376|nr:sugar phosphate isomerase/epimerase [Streptomyces sp. JH14]MDF6040684.1 sugar phosphate isomerase/epimerase [Streptomyces sp. JH14]